MNNQEKINAWCIHNFSVHPSNTQLEDIVSVLNQVETPTRFQEMEDCYLDTKTGLEWSKEDSEKMNWHNAMNQGVNGWRLPTIEELKSIIDYEKFNPATELQSMKNVYYWSASPYPFNSNYAWIVYFGYGYDSYDDKNYSYYVRLVRRKEKENECLT